MEELNMQLTNIQQLREQLANRTDLTNKEKFKIYKTEREQNKATIKSEISEFYIEEITENGALIVKGTDDLNCPCPTTIEINNAEFFLYKDFHMKIGNVTLTIYFKNIELFRIRIEDITQFDIWN